MDKVSKTILITMVQNIETQLASLKSVISMIENASSGQPVIQKKIEQKDMFSALDYASEEDEDDFEKRMQKTLDIQEKVVNKLWENANKEPLEEIDLPKKTKGKK